MIENVFDILFWVIGLPVSMLGICLIFGGTGKWGGRGTWSYLITAIGYFLSGVFSVAGNLMDENYPGAGVCFGVYAAFTAFFLYAWWNNGGGDDFKKRRRKLSQKAKAKFRQMKETFKPKLSTAPAPA